MSHPFFLCFLSSYLIFSIGNWSLLRHLRFRVEDQLALDQCSGNISIKLRDLESTLTQSNQMILRLRESIKLALSTENFVLAKALTLSSITVSQAQNRVVEKWKLTFTEWSLGTSRTQHLPCVNSGNSPEWFRGPPDQLGPQVLSASPHRGPYLFNSRSHSRYDSEQIQSTSAVYSTGTTWKATFVLNESLISFRTNGRIH